MIWLHYEQLFWRKKVIVNSFFSLFFDYDDDDYVNLYEHQESFKCVNGSCIEPPETGKAAIAIYNASLPSKDLEIEGQESDPFVKVFLDQKYLMKTKTLENNNFPVWKQIFMSPLMTSDSQITFIVMDRDTNGEEMLLTVQTTVDLVMALDKNSTVVCAPESSPNYLCYSIAWFPGI